MYKISDKEEAIRLRLLGNSYSEIAKLVGVKSKGTLGVWFKDLVLTPEATKLLEYNIQLATKRKLFAFNELRSSKIKKENEDFRIQGYKLIGLLSKRDLLILGVALYWGEGTKSERNSSYNSLSFANSDPEMIRSYMKFLKDILEVAGSKIRGNIHMYSNMDVNATKQFWSQTTKLPLDQFTASFQVSRAGKGIRKTLPYGTLNVRVHDRKLFFKVKGMIQGVAVS